MKKFCEIAVCTDYHEFGMICESFLGMNLDYLELGCSAGEYVGVIYNGSEPSAGEINQALSRAGMTREDIE